MSSSDAHARLVLGEREYIIIGTAHVSRESVHEVRSVIEQETPDRVCVEIDQSRYRTLNNSTEWMNLDIRKVLRERKGFLLLANLALAALQRRMGLELGVRPGEEMLEAIAAANDHEIPFSLCDREIQITMRRAWMKAGLWGRMKMLSALLASVFTREDLDHEEIEKLKEKGALHSMLDELADYLPVVKEVLIDERDRYLASRIYDAAGRKVVAVVGAGHVAGINRHLQALAAGSADTDIGDLDQIPPRAIVGRVLPWLIPAAVLGLLVTGFVRSGIELSLAMLWRWFFINGTLSAAGALLALAHPLTILIAFVAAPITSMNPTIGVGIFTGIFEAVVRRPRVIDFENLHEDIIKVRGFFRNRITHILVVFFLSSLGSAVGTFIALPFLTRLLPGS